MIGETTFTAIARQGVIKVVAVCEYGNRTVSISEEITDEAFTQIIDEILNKAIESVKDNLKQKAMIAAAESIVVAKTLGEDV
jgi:DNA-binding protein YbaB